MNRVTNQKITVIGIGKLGLGFALILEKAGYQVCGVDIFPDYVKNINEKKYHTLEPQYNELIKNSTKLEATVDLEYGLNFSDTIFIIVQTPNGGGEKFYDHSILSNLLSKINSYQVKNKDIIIGCTVMPQYINNIGLLLIEDCENCTLSYNPEFVAQGEIVKGFLHPDIILIGTNSEIVGEKLKKIYQSFVLSDPEYCIISPLDAEISKITINGYITTKLSFANMISDLCDTVGADKKRVLSTVGGDSRIGKKYFNPGYSFGGPCFPRDTKCLKQYLDQSEINSDLLLATSNYNQLHVDFQTQQLLAEEKEEYVIANVCFKENSKIPMIEESAKLKIAQNLVKAGKNVIIEDEVQIINEVKKNYGNLFTYHII